MTEILRIGPFDERDYLEVANRGYEENRSTAEIDNLVRHVPFSVGEHISEVSGRFPNLDTINVLEGGCGFGFALRGIKGYGELINRRIRTTGITMGIRNLHGLRDGMDHDSYAIDTFIVGDVQNAYNLGLLPDESYHFVLDFYGAWCYSDDFSRDYRMVDGFSQVEEDIISIYSKVLVPGGTALLSKFHFHQTSYIGPPWGEQYEKRRSRVLGLIRNNQFNILRERLGFIIVEKLEGGR